VRVCIYVAYICLRHFRIWDDIISTFGVNARILHCAAARDNILGQNDYKCSGERNY